jgi:hypothetical protein
MAFALPQHMHNVLRKIMIQKAQFIEPEVWTDLFYPKHVVQRAGESNKSVHRIGSVDSC